MRKLAERVRRPLAVMGMVCAATLLGAGLAAAQGPSPTLLVLEKADSSLAMVDPGTMKIVARVPAGPDPHEIVTSENGKIAYISNYGGLDSAFHAITVVDVGSRKPLEPIELGALRSPHGLAFAGGKLYFTVETNKAFGRYDPATRAIDWVMGTGEDRTHMVLVAESLDRIFTSNVSSGTISFIEQVAGQVPPGPAAGGPRKTWEITNVVSGRGSEGFDVSPDGRQLWAANAQDSTVTVIDVASKKATATFPVAVRGNRLKISPDGKQVLVSGAPAGGPGSGGANFVVLDAASHREVKQLTMGGGSGGILIVPDGSRAYVAVASANKVVAVDLKKLETAGEVSTGKGPDGLAWAK